MPSRQLPESLVRAAVQPPAEGADADLLGRFVTERDAHAFAELVRRHGPMVLGVCRRALGNTPDADDAFQAVWLVLVRKATSVSPRGAVGNWLYGVATRTAAHARCAIARRRTAQRELPDVPDPKPHNSDAPEIASVIDAELAHLPHKYRAAVVLCELEGRSLKETADQLGVPVGTVASRLARGRALLAERLKAKGFAASVFVGLLASATAPVSARLHDLAVALLTVGPQELARPVSEIARGVLTTMLAEKLKVTGKWFAALALGIGAVVWVAAAGAQPTPPTPAPKSEGAKGDPPPVVNEGNPFVGRLDVKIPRRPAEEAAWDRLLLDEPDASRAVLELASMPKEAVALFAKKLQPLKADTKEVARLIADLGSEKEEGWTAARAKLLHLDPRLALDPREAFAQAKTLSAQNRLAMILIDQFDPVQFAGRAGSYALEVTVDHDRGASRYALLVTTDDRRVPRGAAPIEHRVAAIRRASWTQMVRAAVILEHIGTPEAQAILKELATGHPDVLVTQTAKQALIRLNPKAP
jgi:RNA polymerase sigma factor (sigma-70 family)